MSWAINDKDYSQRRACRLIGLAPKVYRYRTRRHDDGALRARLRSLALARRRFGYWRLYLVLRREGLLVNHKKVYRLYKDEGLGLRRRKPRRRRAAMSRRPRVALHRSNERWAMDFMSDALANGQKLRVLTVVDAYTRECVALEAGSHFRGPDVARVLTRVALHRGLPAVINCDNGTEFTSRAMDHWAWAHGVQLDFSRPGKPTDNATIESFNASVRRECLSEHYFSTLAEAQVVLGLYRAEYNNVRPHSSLGQKTPAAFRAGTEIHEDSNKVALQSA